VVELSLGSVYGGYLVKRLPIAWSNYCAVVCLEICMPCAVFRRRCESKKPTLKVKCNRILDNTGRSNRERHVEFSNGTKQNRPMCCHRCSTMSLSDIKSPRSRRDESLSSVEGWGFGL